MGQRMPPVPHIYGDDCLLKFDPDKTPKYVYARFSGIEKCPGALFTPPNDRLFKLTQVEGHPCWWSLIIPGSWVVRFEYEPGPARTKLILSAPPNFLFFAKVEPTYIDEGVVLHSDQEVCAGWVHGIGGTGVVTWTQQATELLESINMQRADDLFMEMRPLVDGNLIYKFCKLKDGTNISIEFEPD